MFQSSFVFKRKFYLYGNRMISSVIDPKPILFKMKLKKLIDSTIEKIASIKTLISKFPFQLGENGFEILLVHGDTYSMLKSETLKIPNKLIPNLYAPSIWMLRQFNINVLPKNVHIQDSVVNKFTRFHNFVVSAGYLVQQQYGSYFWADCMFL